MTHDANAGPYRITERVFSFKVSLREYVDLMGVKIVSDSSVPDGVMRFMHPDGRVDEARQNASGEWELVEAPK